MNVDLLAETLNDRPRFARYGRLAPQIGVPAARQVRGACDGCGSHLLAVPHDDGHLTGTCPVCLGGRITPVASHHAAA